MGLHNLSQSKASNYSYQLLLACCGKGSKEAKGKERREQESREERGGRREENRRAERRKERGERREERKRCGMHYEQFPANFPKSMGKLYGMYCEQLISRQFPDVYGKALRDVL